MTHTPRLARRLARSLARPLAAATVVALAVGFACVAAPASAESTVANDPADATASLTDIRRVTVNHGLEQVITKVRFTDLVRSSDAGPSGMTVFFDSRPGRKGPELRFDTGLQEGTDYQVTRTKGWAQSGDPLTCPASLRLKWAEDVAVVRVSRECLGDPAKVRVAVKMVDLFDGSHPVTDWLGNPRSFTSYVAAG